MKFTKRNKLFAILILVFSQSVLAEMTLIDSIYEEEAKAVICYRGDKGTDHISIQKGQKVQVYSVGGHNFIVGQRGLQGGALNVVASCDHFSVIK